MMLDLDLDCTTMDDRGLDRTLPSLAHLKFVLEIKGWPAGEFMVT